MIKNADISIVVQGPILLKSKHGITDETTALVCKRLKRIFPESELILSTWEGSDVKSIPYDKLVFSKDPGAVWMDYGHPQSENNCNRLIVSAYAGINAASSKFVLKVRSDLFIYSKEFLKYFYKFPHFDDRYKFVKNRIIAFSLYTIKGHKTSYFKQWRPYHISDWAYFGYRDDLINLFDIPLTNEPEFSQWFASHPKPFFDIHPWRLWKMPPEQYITTSFLKKYIDIKFEHMSDTSNHNIELSNQLLTNNFLVLDQNQFSLISLKYLDLQLLFEPILAKSAVFYRTWLKDYYQYCKAPHDIYYFIDKLRILWQQLCYQCLNFLLTRINKKNQKITRLLSYIIKRQAI